MNCDIWRSDGARWMLASCNLAPSGYISIAGLWGKTSQKPMMEFEPTFHDKEKSEYHYMLGKGKNWPLFKALCPDLSEFEFWDENETRGGTLEQERFLFNAGLRYASYAEQIDALEGAGMKEVEVAKSTGTKFPPQFSGQKYLYGTLTLAIPLPDKTTLNLMKLIRKEQE